MDMSGLTVVFKERSPNKLYLRYLAITVPFLSKATSVLYRLKPEGAQGRLSPIAA